MDMDSRRGHLGRCRRTGEPFESIFLYSLLIPHPGGAAKRPLPHSQEPVHSAAECNQCEIDTKAHPLTQDEPELRWGGNALWVMTDLGCSAYDVVPLFAFLPPRHDVIYWSTSSMGGNSKRCKAMER